MIDYFEPLSLEARHRGRGVSPAGAAFPPRPAGGGGKDHKPNPPSDPRSQDLPLRSEKFP